MAGRVSRAESRRSPPAAKLCNCNGTGRENCQTSHLLIAFNARCQPFLAGYPNFGICIGWCVLWRNGRKP